MKVVRQFALILVLAILLPLVAPAMVCAFPRANLTPVERACCKQMKGQCGNMAMPASHGCCHMEIPTVSLWNTAVQVKSASVQIDLSAVAGHSPAILVPVRVALADYSQQPGSTLPQSPPSAISVLRI